MIIRNALRYRRVPPTLLCLSASLFAMEPCHAKEDSVFYPAHLVAEARKNADTKPWAAKIRKRLIEVAQPWMRFSDDQLWDFMFGPTITRSWMVLSSGQCPSCKKDVRMYTWQIDAFARPWKCRCPHCNEVFPKNDFQAFYRSGLDEHAVFDYKRADRSLLYNTEHPRADDPLRGFGVDDGNGYSSGQNRWRFIGTYLVYGQWKQLIVAGIRNLAAAYLITGDAAYAHKAGILLDRVADLYPTFDFGKQAILYELPAHRGYVSPWHDACAEVETLAIAYDQVFTGLKADADLPRFLSEKAKRYKIENPKASFADVRRNIEERIFRDTLNNRPKIESNYPTTDVAITLIKTVLDWPGNKAEVNALIDAIVKRATAVDGVTGEKGLAGYATIGPHNLAPLIGRYDRIDPRFLDDLLKRHPQLHQTYRFHIDLWCQNGRYYPNSGDCGAPGMKHERYAGLALQRTASLEPSDYVFLRRLHEATKDPALVQVLYHANQNSIDGLPHDLFAADPGAFQQAVKTAIEAYGTEIQLQSANKQQWHMAVLRSGRGPHRREVWLDYDAGGPHGHADGMNLGLFAKGLDLMMDFGYPPVSHGGWSGPKFSWYVVSASHNTVVVDGKSQPTTAGRTTLWADGDQVRTIRASGPTLIGGKPSDDRTAKEDRFRATAAPNPADAHQYERSVVMVDISDEDFYFADIFRVVGGTDHAKFTHSHFARMSTPGLSLKPSADYGHGTLMRGFQTDPSPQSGWYADWQVDDRYKYLPPGRDVHLRYTDATRGAQASRCERWVLEGSYALNQEVWLPTIMIRHRTDKPPLATTFAGVFEVYEKGPNVARVNRLALTTQEGTAYPDSYVAIEIQLTDGRRDLLITADVENPLGVSPAWPKDGPMLQPDWKVTLDGELVVLRRDTTGKIILIGAARCRSVAVDGISARQKGLPEFVEIKFPAGASPVQVAGGANDIESITIDGKKHDGIGGAK